MKQGKFAVYQKNEYASGRMKDGRLILRSTEIKDISKGFEACEPFRFKGIDRDIVCLKFIELEEAEDYYRLRINARYLGFDFEVVEEKEEMVSLVTMKGDYRVWVSLGMDCIDKGVYQKWVGKDEVEISIEKKSL